jgi:hypothetical protein
MLGPHSLTGGVGRLSPPQLSLGASSGGGDNFYSPDVDYCECYILREEIVRERRGSYNN